MSDYSAQGVSCTFVAQCILGVTPLLKSIQNNLDDIARMLINHGARPDISCEDGDTPLIASTRHENTAMVQLLTLAE